MTENIRVIFEEMGLNEKEIAIYENLNKVGLATASMIARSCNLQRSSCYLLIEKLVEKGVLSKIIRDNVQFFLATDPIILLEEMRIKQESLMKRISNLKNSFQSKKADSLKNTWSKARYFCGRKGIAYVLEDILNEKPDKLRSLISKSFNLQMDDIYPCFSRKRAMREIPAKVIYTLAGEDYFQTFKDDLVMRESRVLPQRYSLGMDILTYNNKVAIISVEENFALLIESQIVSSAVKTFFDSVWMLAKKLSGNTAKFTRLTVNCHAECSKQCD